MRSEQETKIIKDFENLIINAGNKLQVIFIDENDNFSPSIQRDIKKYTCAYRSGNVAVLSIKQPVVPKDWDAVALAMVDVESILGKLEEEYAYSLQHPDSFKVMMTLHLNYKNKY